MITTMSSIDSNQYKDEVMSLDDEMRRLSADGVYTYPNFNKDKAVATELFEDEEFEQLQLFLTRIDSKQKYHNGNRDHFLLATMHSADFDYPGWPDDLEFIKEVFLTSVNAFAESDTRRLLRGMVNKQKLHDGNDLPAGMLMLQSKASEYGDDNEDFECIKRDAMNAYQAGYDDVFEQCIEKIRNMEKQGIGEEVYGNFCSLDLRRLELSAIEEAGESCISSSISSSMESLHITPITPNCQRVVDQNSEPFAIPVALDTNFISPEKEDEARNKGTTSSTHNVQNMKQSQCSNRGALSPGDPLATIDLNSMPSPPSRILKPSTEIETKQPTDVRPYLSPCAICLESVTSHIFVPCGHLALCSQCATSPPYTPRFGRRKVRHRCPICRKESREIIKVFY
eukprot:347507_1